MKVIKKILKKLKRKTAIDEMREELKKFQFKASFVDNNEKNSTTILNNEELQMEHVVIHTEPNILHDTFIIDVHNKKQSDFIIRYFKTIDEDIDFSKIISHLTKKEFDFECHGSTTKDLYLEMVSETKTKIGIIDYNYTTFNSALDIQACFNDLVMSIKLIPMFFNIDMHDFFMTPSTINTKSLGEKALNIKDHNDFILCKTELANKFIVKGKHLKHDIDFDANFNNGFKNINFIYSIKKENRGLVNVLLKILKEPIISPLFSEHIDIEPQIWNKLYNDFYNGEKSESEIENVFTPSYVKAKANFKIYNAYLKVVDDETKIYFKLELKECEFDSIYNISNGINIEILK